MFIHDVVMFDIQGALFSNETWEYLEYLQNNRHVKAHLALISRTDVLVVRRILSNCGKL